MGANAQTAVPTFTASQVLTAAQQNNSARTGVPVFASTTTRNAAFGGSNKTLAEGQLCYVEGTGLQTYNGTAWVTWGAAPSAGLTWISTTTIGSAVASVTVSSVFSATYDNYRIIISGGAASTTNNIQLQLGATTTGYYANTTDAAWAGGTGNQAQSNTAFWNIGAGATTGLGTVIDLFQPFSTDETWFVGLSARPDSSGYMAARGGMLNNTTSYTAFTIAASTGTFTGGTIRVYGYQNS